MASKINPQVAVRAPVAENYDKLTVVVINLSGR